MGNDTIPAQFVVGLEELRREYVRKLPEKIVAIADAWRHVLHDERDEEMFLTLRELLHNLIGSAGTFGLHPLSEAARTLSTLCKALQASGNSPTDAQRTQITVGLETLHHTATLDLQPRPSRIENELETPCDLEVKGLDGNRLVMLCTAEHSLAQYLTQQLGHFGYTVQTVTDWTELHHAVQEDTRPLALLIDTAEVTDNGTAPKTRTMFQTVRTASLPLIFLSARDDVTARLQATRAGARAYVTKPVDVHELIDVLDVFTTPETTNPYRILVIEDDTEVAAYHAGILEHAGMATTVLTDPLRVMTPLVEFAPELILMDVYMPGCNGIELAAVIRQQSAYLGIPIVYLSAETNLQKQLLALRLGDDFLTKPIRPEHLISAVMSRVQRFRALRSLILRDGLTGLLNHTSFKEHLSREIARVRRQAAPLALAIIDLDHFKTVNDIYGHPTGDRVIKSVARVLQQRLRRTDVIGRYGGEEFAVLFPNTTGMQAQRVMDEIRATFAQVRHQSEGREFHVTFSSGVATCPPHNEAASLTQAADQVLYASKEAGRNCVVLAGQ